MPKIDVPFKCYIYCTKDHTFAEKTLRGFDENGKAIYYKANKGKVIGEFVCNNVFDYNLDPYGHHSYFISDDDFESTCLTFYEVLWDYGKGKTLYGWHITDLVIYDKPKELSEFYIKRYSYGSFDKIPVPCERPPQNWYYVEEVRNG